VVFVESDRCVATGHPRDHPSPRHLRRCPPRRGLRQSTTRRGSELSHRQGHTGRRHRPWRRTARQPHPSCV